MRLTNASQMRELDRRACEEFGVPSIVLMENAGLRTFDVVMRKLKDMGGSRVAIVCGRGNNGGDGFVVARHLHESGVDVRVFVIGPEDGIKGDALTNLNIAKLTGIKVLSITDTEKLAMRLAHADLVVDALFGTGVKGEVSGLPGEVVEAINDSGRCVVSVDLPSGVDSDTGQVIGSCVRADTTVTFALPKIGLVQYPGAAYAGDITVAEIGIPEAAIRTAGITTFFTEASDVKYRLPMREPDSHKGTFGHAALIAGSVGLTGAAALAAASAVRAGAGLVTLGIPHSLNDIIEAKVTEAMTVPLPETEARSVSSAAIEQALALIEKCSCVAIGPGLGMHPDTVRFVQEILPEITKPMVIDADALNAISENVEIMSKLQSAAILTPHPGEMSRLTGTPVAAVQSNRVNTAMEAAVQFGATIVLKGAGTVIASPDGEVWINSTGSPALASGGTGDVLTGTIVGLLADGIAPMDAAICGVFIHGLAGEMAADTLGEVGVAATDLLPFLTKAIDLISTDEDETDA